MILLTYYFKKAVWTNCVCYVLITIVFRFRHFDQANTLCKVRVFPFLVKMCFFCIDFDHRVKKNLLSVFSFCLVHHFFIFVSFFAILSFQSHQLFYALVTLPRFPVLLLLFIIFNTTLSSKINLIFFDTKRASNSVVFS